MCDSDLGEYTPYSFFKTTIYEVYHVSSFYEGKCITGALCNWADIEIPNINFKVAMETYPEDLVLLFTKNGQGDCEILYGSWTYVKKAYRLSSEYETTYFSEDVGIYGRSMKQEKILILYESVSGNTEDLAFQIKEKLKEHLPKQSDPNLQLCNVFKESQVPDIRQFDIVYIGTWTCNFGNVPPTIGKVLKKNQEVLKEKAIYLFGTGETQWGEENFCGALDVTERFFKRIRKSQKCICMLKVEQRAVSSKDKQRITAWVLQTLREKDELI